MAVVGFFGDNLDLERDRMKKKKKKNDNRSGKVRLEKSHDAENRRGQCYLG